nr:phosphoribosylglycinamide formyltransferase [Kribbella sp. VKM Ac-2527]
MSANLVVLASGEGTTLQAILDACGTRIDATITAVGTDRLGTGAEARAGRHGIPVFTNTLEDFTSRDDFDRALARAIGKFDPDLLVLAGYMKILSSAVIGTYPTINTHPALSPSFPGAHAVRDALAHGVKVTGVTIHWVDEGIDTGEIIAQAPVAVADDDTTDSLRRRIQSIERDLYVKVIGELVSESPLTLRRHLTQPGIDRDGETGSDGPEQHQS